MFGRSLRCLEWIDFLSGFFDFSLDVRRCRTVSRKPFAGRFRIDLAVLTGWAIYDFDATLTLLYYCVAITSIKSTAILAHEGTLGPNLDGLTDHWNHPLSYLF
jgi:hypothetical protein